MDFEPAALLTHSQLATAGLGPNDIRTRLREGVLRRVRHGIYSEGEEPDGQAAQLELAAATMPLLDPTTVLSHASAAILHGIPVPREHLAKAWVTRRTPGHGRHGKNLVIRNTRITDSEVTVIDGMRVTTLARTASDLMRTLPQTWSVAVGDAALRLGVERSDLRAAVELHPNLRGLGRARNTVEFADGASESVAESISRANMVRAGLPMPLLQQEIFNAAGELIGRPDFLWPELKLIGEVDGAVKYGALLRPGQTVEEVVMAEKQREEEFRQDGYWFCRWGWPIANDASALRRLLRGAMVSQARALGL